MSCQETPCTSGSESCYDNCGCLNPTEFVCVSYTGPDLVHIGVDNTDTGNDVLLKLDTQIGLLQDKSGKVLIDANDTCPEFLLEKLFPGTNISLQVIGTGCNKQIRIDSTLGGIPVDIKVKSSANDTTADYLFSKVDTGSAISKSISSPSGNEKVKFDIIYSELLSSDSGNMLVIGSDGKIKTSFTDPDGSETKIAQGTGVLISGSGTIHDPYVVSTNPSIQALRPCFDGAWKDITVISYTNTNITTVSGVAKYRYRYDGSIEFKGSMTFNVAFGNYASANRKYTITIGTIPTSCLSVTEQSGTIDMKNTNYIDIPQASADQITQQYGYTIRKSAQNIILEFQSSFTNNTTKTIVVNFDGAVHHPNF